MYEGTKGVCMPFAEKAYEAMGIDEGGKGSNSGGYDHLGYSVLMNTYEPQLCPADLVPTELSPQIEYSTTLNATFIPSLAQERKRGLVNGKVTNHNELGALVNTYSTTQSTLLPQGKTLRLIPQLPEGEEDTGAWQWNTGETTREITVNTDWSFVYRVTYTNALGIQSHLAFFIATTDKGQPVGIKRIKSSSLNNRLEANAYFDMSGRRVVKPDRHNIVVSKGKKLYNP
jgi:hypothetical protein